MVQITPISRPGAFDFSRHFLLESAESDSPWSHWSYSAGPPYALLQCDSTTLVTTLSNHRGIVGRWTDPIAALAWLQTWCHERPTAGPPFKGGWLGYISYDVGRLFEKLPARASDDLRLPLFSFTFHDDVVATSTTEAFRCSSDDTRPLLDIPSSYSLSSGRPQSVFSQSQYIAAVQKSLDYISAGDIFQVNLSQRFTAGLTQPPRTIYENLRRDFPAWFGAYLDFGDHALLCNSPELFLRVTPDPATGKRHVLTRPIKGTRPRGDGMDHALLNSPKDQAELAMIVDLERNDLGRICEIGSVRVTEPRTIERHPTVYHGAATIEGALRKDVTFIDLLRATFPGGSVTGAPKIRAMEIIEELEPVRRGPYCGAIGYLSIDGHIEFNIAIRTMIAQHNRVHFSVGGGIVADSDPAAEYDETLVKAKAMFASLEKNL